MSPQDEHDAARPASLKQKLVAAEHKLEEAGRAGVQVARRRWRWLAWTAAVLAILVIAVKLYTLTDDFQRRLRNAVIAQLEDATGGRTEIGHIDFRLWHLSVHVDDLVIHGTEPAGQAPYIAAKSVDLELKVHLVVARLFGAAPQRVTLRRLAVEQPAFHLTVDKDGRTNAPTLRHPAQTSNPIQDTLLDLRAERVTLSHGMALINDRQIPLNLAANDLALDLHYVGLSDRYAADLTLGDLQTQLDAMPVVKSKLKTSIELGRDVLLVKTLEFATDAKTTLSAQAELDHFASPVWKGTAKGSIDVREIGYLTSTPSLTGGSIAIDARATSCSVTAKPVSALTPPKRKLFGDHARLPPQTLADDGCAEANHEAYIVLGTVLLHDVGYRDEYVRFRDVNGSARMHIRPTELKLDELIARLPGGGEARGTLILSNWLEDAYHAHSKVEATVDHIPLRSIMATTGPERYADLGLDTSITGPATVTWGGTPDTSKSVDVIAKLEFTPTGSKLKDVLDNTQVSGHVDGHYEGLRQTVRVNSLDLHTAATDLTAHGILGVNHGSPLTVLDLNLTANDLSEYDQLFEAINFNVNGRTGRKALPADLRGQMTFIGTARGDISDLDVKGHMTATDLLVHGASTDIHLDSAVVDGEFSPNGGVNVVAAELKRGTTVMTLSGEFHPHSLWDGRHTQEIWDAGMSVDAKTQVSGARVEDVLEIAGIRQQVPVSGGLSFTLRAQGTFRAATGEGTIQMTKGVAYGQPFDQINAKVQLSGQRIGLPQFTVVADGVSLNGSGEYDLPTKHIRGVVDAPAVVLAKVTPLQQQLPQLTGKVSLHGEVNGTAEAPNLKLAAQFSGLQWSGTAVGSGTVNAHSEGSDALYDAHLQLTGADVSLNGRTKLSGNFDTDARLVTNHVDAGKLLPIFTVNAMKAASDVSGNIVVRGPLKNPQQLAGTAEFHPLKVVLQGVALEDKSPLRASLANGMLRVEPVEITGRDTDFRAEGTVQLFGGSDPASRPINVKASGRMDLAIAHTLNPDILSSGAVKFDIAATGNMQKPLLTGNVEFQHGNLALDGVANGLSDVNGTLEFNQDRLDIQKMTGTTGGGKLNLGGYLAYRKGLFADVTATGTSVRVRYNGLSATADTNLQLLGTSDDVVLSGNVLITRFGVGQDVDFSALAGGGGAASIPDPTALTNKVRLDVHIASAPQMDFQNSYAKLAGTVDLALRGTVAQPAVLGRIQITDGSATFAGTKYDLQRGTIYFTNPVRIDPVIDIDATARVENYDITIGLHGTTTRLKPTYRSEPPLSEADIFNLLALGRTQEEAQLYQEQQLQAGTDPTTSALLGGALNATVSNRVGRLFGAGSVKIDPAFVGTLGTSAARITVQEPLSKQLTAVFATNVNQTAQQLIQVQYQLDENTSLVATRDESGVFSVVYKIRRRYR